MLKKFVRELRRREVFRTAGLYVGVCWILIEVSSVLLPTFEAPEWMMRTIVILAVVGFPVMLVLAWFYDVTDHGIEIQGDATDTVVAAIGTRKMDFVVIGVLTVALLFSVYLNITSGPEVNEQPELVSVLMADFDNQTGDSVFDGSLGQALQIGVESTPFVNTYQRSAALRILSQLQQAEVTALSEEDAQLVAVREGINVILAGSIESDGPGYEIAVRVLDGATGEEIAEADGSAESKLEVLEAVGAISGDLRKALGDDSVGSGDEGSIETFTAASIEAARDYTQAQELARAAKYDEAVAFYESAVSKDPNFGRALSGWALTLFELGRTDEATAMWERALSKMEMMTDRERMRTLGLYYMAVSGNYQKAIESYESLVAAYPADGAGHNNLAVAYFSTLNFERAMQEGQRVLEIYPSRLLYKQNLALYAMYAGEFDLAESRAREVIEEDSSRSWAWIPAAISLLARGEPDAAADVYSEMADTGTRAESQANLGLADIAIYRGRFDEAITLLEGSIAADQESGNQRAIGTKYIALAEAFAENGDSDASKQAIDSALAASGGLARQVPAAILNLDLGRTDAAVEIANELSQQLQPQSRAYAQMILGIIDSRDGRHASAIDKLVSGIQLSDSWLLRYYLGQAYLAAGSAPEALDEFNICQSRRGEASSVFLDDLPTWRYMANLPYWQGRAQQELGMTTAALQSFEEFLALRPEGHPLADDARQRMQN